MKRFTKVIIATFFVAFATLPQSIFAQNSTSQNEEENEYIDEDGDYYDEEDVRLTQNGEGDQFISLKLMPLFPLNFGKNLYVGGGLSIGYHRFINQFWALGGDVMFGYNTTIGSNLFTIIPFTFAVTFQPYVGKFEFPITVNVGAAIESYLQYNYFPGLVLKGDAGTFYRMNESWSFGLELSAMYLPQWYKDNDVKYDYYLGLAIMVAARYHF